MLVENRCFCVLLFLSTFFAGLSQHLQIGVGDFGNCLRSSGIDGGQVDQVAAHAKGVRAGSAVKILPCEILSFEPVGAGF